MAIIVIVAIVVIAITCQYFNTSRRPSICWVCMCTAGEKPFMCPYVGCGRSFTTSNIRKVHIRTHTGERPYSCDMPGCGKTFASATNYKNHIRIHSGIYHSAFSLDHISLWKYLNAL